MRRTWFGGLLAVLLVGWMAPAGLAQDTKSARGTVTAIAGDTVTIKAADREMKFTIDPKTVLVASGAGTADRRAEAAGKPGPKLVDFVKVGDGVEVSYTEAGAVMRATRVQRVASVGSGGSSADKPMTSNGTVTSISGSTLTISGSSGGGGTFTQSYTVNRETNVVAVGAGTAAAAKGGTLSLTDAVGVGDQVAVTYRNTPTGLHAEQVRVTAKKK